MFVIQCDKCDEESEYISAMGWFELKSFPVFIPGCDKTKAERTWHVCPDCYKYIEQVMNSGKPND